MILKKINDNRLNRPKTLQQATDFLLSYSPPRLKGHYTLGNMRRLMQALGNPQDNYRIVHIAGTSGKTSTAYHIREMLEMNGLKVGLTVSPHVVSINERLQIDGKPVDEQVFISVLNDFVDLVDQLDMQPTYFEMLVALAYWAFSQFKVDIAVVETGLGGLLDGTNVATREDKLCVITDIGLDHTEILGDTLEQIVEQKCGIVHPGNLVLMNHQSQQVYEWARQAVLSRGGNLRFIGQTVTDTDEAVNFRKRNLVLASHAAMQLVGRSYLPLQDGQHLSSPPGRMEHFTLKNGSNLMLDGAHNSQKLEALLASPEIRDSKDGDLTILVAFLKCPKSKLISMLQLLGEVGAELVVTEFEVGQNTKSKKSWSAKQVQVIADGLGISVSVEKDPEKAMRTLVTTCSGNILVTGSLYLVSRVRPCVVASARVAKNEG